MSGYDVFEVPVDGGVLAVGRWSGGPDAPVVLAAHGITANHLAWAAVARALGGAVTLVAPDLRGRGRSNELPEPFGVSAHADDLVAVLDELGLARVALAGHSMGAFVATTAAAEHPERFGPLVLVDGGLSLPVPPAADIDAMIEAFLGPAIARLSMTFASRGDYREFWQAHPAFADSWSDEVDNYVQYDLVGAEPELRSACSRAAVRTDGSDILLNQRVIDAVQAPATEAVLLWATRGLMDEPQGLYDEHRIGLVDLDPHRIRVEAVPGTNHYSILLGEPGASAVAREIAVAAS
ncbi:MAG: alpha/beta fold hydrolase [Geodermatophilaceae bacterium]|nr:alpha/beta fold hydrolase [Geodermatophilaceae bacterium]